MTNDEFRYIRKKLGLSQAAIAQRLGVSRRTVITWEQAAKIPGPAEVAVSMMLQQQRSKGE